MRPVLHALDSGQPLAFDLTRLRCALFFDAQALLQGTKGTEEEREIPRRWHRLVDAIRVLVTLNA